MCFRLQLLARLGVADPRAFMSGAHPDSLALESAFVSPQLLTQLAAAMEEATLGGHWADALANLPPAISQSDASSLLKKTCASTAQGSSLNYNKIITLEPAAHSHMPIDVSLGTSVLVAIEEMHRSSFAKQCTHCAGKVLAGTCLISNQLLDSLRERVRGLAREAADAAIQSRRASAKAASTSVSSAQSGEIETFYMEHTNHCGMHSSLSEFACQSCSHDDSMAVFASESEARSSIHCSRKQQAPAFREPGQSPRASDCPINSE